eukprot:m.695090 g.695090  ORF g.695090 m.695090 type:complete len:193 (+) comp22886_c0_seq17:530-1108(+)
MFARSLTFNAQLPCLCATGCRQGIRAAALERDTTSRLKFRGTGETRAEHEALEAHREKLARNRDNDAASLTSALEKTRGEVKQFRDMLQNISSAPSFVARVQRLMSQIEGDVLALKDAQRQAYEDLLAREKLLTRDLAAFEERLQQWDRPGAMQPVPAGTGRDGGWHGPGTRRGVAGVATNMGVLHTHTCNP